MSTAFEINSDGSAKDPTAFKNALLADQEKMKELEKDQKAFEIVKGNDIEKFQELLKETYKVEKPRIEAARQFRCNRTIEAQRASATVPKDTVQLYKQMHDIGLQYGPSFRLLRNVHVPDTSQ
eukprot:g4034.t1